MGTGQGRGSATKVAVMSVVGGVAAPRPAGPLGMLPCTLCVRTCVCVRVCERQRQADRGRGRVCLRHTPCLPLPRGLCTHRAWPAAFPSPAASELVP